MDNTTEHRDEAEATEFRVTTGTMSYGPHAVARHDGKVIFVRGAAPDEVVDVKVRENRHSYAFADLVRVQRPSPERREAPCPYLPRCGGCPWQHIEYQAQLTQKETLVREQLKRIGGIEADHVSVLAAPREYAYRRRLKLRVQSRKIGFYAGATHTLVPIDHCLLAAPEINDCLPAAADLIAKMHSRVRRIELALAGEHNELVVSGEVEGDWVGADANRCRRWLAAQHGVRGLVIAGRRWRRKWGDDRTLLTVGEGLSLICHAGTFTQVNAEANRLLVDLVTRLARPDTGPRLLDLYAGAGNFALPLAKHGARVTAVEESRRAAADGAANAKSYGLAECRFLHTRAEKAVAQLAASAQRIDGVILDPPRNGAAETLRALRKIAPPWIIYVSCNPTTLARDLKRLAESYRLDATWLIDMFPHTYHVETVTRLVHRQA